MKFDSVQIFVDGIVALFGTIFYILGQTIKGLWKSRFLFSLIILVLLWLIFPDWYKENAVLGNIILISSVVISLITWVVTIVKKNKEKRESNQTLEQVLDVTKLSEKYESANRVALHFMNECNRLENENSRLKEKCSQLEKEKQAQKQENTQRASQSSRVPLCFQMLYFKEIPDTRDEVKKRFRRMSKAFHPDTDADASSDAECFIDLKNACDECMKYYK